jgi:hypothetical protein
MRRDGARFRRRCLGLRGFSAQIDSWGELAEFYYRADNYHWAERVAKWYKCDLKYAEVFCLQTA